MEAVKDISVGVIVFRKRKAKEPEYLLIRHGKGHWGFPKGHIDSGESKPEAALRELNEETGIKKIKLISEEILIKDLYTFREKDRVVEKTVEYFIGEFANDKDEPGIKVDGKEITEFRWCGLKDSLKLLTFEESKFLILKADNIIKQIITNPKKRGRQ